MKKILLCYCYWALSLSNIQSSDLNVFRNTSLKSNAEIRNEAPSTFQLGRYDNFSINEYLGTPQISIPIYTMKLPGIEIPINISYQATGIKVNQDASSVGLGWDLSSLGSVVQIIRGDDDTKPYYPESYQFLPDYYSAHYPNFEPAFDYNSDFYPIKETGYPVEDVKELYGYKTSFQEYFPINGNMVSEKQLRYSTTYWDTEPDIFIINILGERLNCVTSDFSKTISNVKRSGNMVEVLNRKDYRVERLKDEDKWIVTDPKGTRFFFDIKQVHQSYSYSAVSSFGGAGGQSSSSTGISQNTWYLTKIETAVGVTVYLDYDVSNPVEFVTKSDGDMEYIYEESVFSYMSNGKYFMFPPYHLINMFINKSPIVYSNITSSITEKQYQLKIIRSGEYSVNFSNSNREDIPAYKKLDSLTVSFSGKPFHKAIFKYNYVPNLTEGKRLFLLSLSCNGENYQFNYNPTQLPPRNSYAQDYWGYFNGSTGNTSLVPNPKTFGHVFPSKFIEDYYGINNNNISANVNYTKAGILEKITYPTGGSVSFEYGLNTFSNFWVPNYTNSNKDKIRSEGFGLRVEAITYKDSDSKIRKKESYKYYGGRSVVNHNFYKEGSIMWFYNDHFDRHYTENFHALSTSGLSDISPFSTHTGVGYDSVSCVYEDVINDKSCRTTTVYNNVPQRASAPLDVMNNNILHTIHMPSFEESVYPKNGSVREKRYYDDSNHLLKKEIYSYRNERSKLFYGVKLMKISDVMLRELIIDNGGADDKISYSSGFTRYLLGFYPVFDFQTLLIKKIEQNYYPNDTLSTEITYGYDSYRRQDTIKTKLSNGKVLLKRNVYETWNWNNLNIYSLLNKEEMFTNGAQMLYRTYGYSPPTPNIRSITEGKSPRDNLYLTEYDYTLFGHPKSITSDEGATVYLWAYNGNHCIAQIKNSSLGDVEAAVKSLFSVASLDDLSKMSIPNEVKLIDGSLQRALPYAQVTTYTYQPLVGMTSATAPNGVTTYYEYDAFNRLKRTYIIENGQQKTVQSYGYHYKQ